MQMIGLSPLEMLLLVLLGGGFGLPSGVPPTAEDPLAAKVAPADCLFYAAWAGTGEPNAESGNHTERLLAEPEVRDFLNRARDAFFESMQAVQRDPNAQETSKDIKKIMQLIRGKAGAFYISDLKLNRNAPPDLRGGAVLRMDADGPAIKQILEGLQNNADQIEVKEFKVGARSFYRVALDKDAPPISWGLADKYLIIGIGDGSAEDLMQRARGQAPAWLTSAKAKLSVPRLSSIVYVNTKKIIQLAVDASGEAEAQRIVSVLGLDQLGDAVMVNGLDETGCVMRASLAVEGAPAGIFSWLDTKPITAADLEQIPAAAPVAIAFKLDAAKLYDLWMDLASQIDPGSAQQMVAGVQQMEQQVGVHIRDDLLASLGDTWRIFAQPGPTGLISGWTIAGQVRDRQKLEQVNNTLTQMAQAALQQGGPGVPTLQKSEIANHTVHTLAFAQPGVPAAPSWCVTDDELLIAVTPQQLEAHLSAAPEGDSIAQNNDVKSLFQADSNTLAFAYVDTQTVAKTLLPLAQMGIQMAAGQRGAPPLTTDGLPSQEALLPHLQPSLFALQRTTDGVEFTSRQTLPGGNIGATAPAMVALMLPAVHSARQAARRTQTATNLKQIALAMHNFHTTHQAFPAGYNADEEGKPLLSWRVHILPFIDQQALYEQFHLDEPWDSPHNKALIAKMPAVYRCPDSHANPGITNYLGVAGKDGVFVKPKPGNRLGVSITEITDGTSPTIMTLEVPDDRAVIWTKPADFSPDPDDPIKGLLGLRPNGFQAGLADGSVRFFVKAIDAGVLKAMFTKAGGEVIQVP